MLTVHTANTCWIMAAAWGGSAARVLWGPLLRSPRLYTASASSVCVCDLLRASNSQQEHKRACADALRVRMRWLQTSPALNQPRKVRSAREAREAADREQHRGAEDEGDTGTRDHALVPPPPRSDAGDPAHPGLSEAQLAELLGVDERDVQTLLHESDGDMSATSHDNRDVDDVEGGVHNETGMGYDDDDEMDFDMQESLKNLRFKQGHVEGPRGRLDIDSIVDDERLAALFSQSQSTPSQEKDQVKREVVKFRLGALPTTEKGKIGDHVRVCVCV